MRGARLAPYLTSPLLITSACLVSACGVDVAGAREEMRASEMPSLSVAAPSRGATQVDESEPVLLEGDGFTLRYPGDASIRPLDAEAAPGAAAAVEIRGPELRDVEGDPIDGSASYSFEVVTYANDEQLPLELWLARQRAASDGGRGVVTTVSSREHAESPPVASKVGSMPALRESRFGGDCDLVRYYVAHGARVVAFRYADFPIESDSLNAQHLRTYARVMSTFRWKDAPARS